MPSWQLPLFALTGLQSIDLVHLVPYWLSTPALSLVFDPKISTCSSRSAVVELPPCCDALQPPLMPLVRVQSLSRLLRFTFERADQLRTGHLKDDLVTRRLAWTGREAPKSPVPGPVRTIEPCRTTWRTLGSSPRSEEQGPETSGSLGIQLQSSPRSRSASLSRGTKETFIPNQTFQLDLALFPALRKVLRPHVVSPSGRFEPLGLLWPALPTPKRKVADVQQVSEPRWVQLKAKERASCSEERRGYL